MVPADPAATMKPDFTESEPDSPSAPAPLPAGAAPSSDEQSVPSGDGDARASFKASKPETVSLAELTALCRPPVVVDLPLGGRRIRFEGHALTAAEMASVEALTLTLVPPMRPGPDGKKEPDPADPKFLEDLNRLNRQKAALAIVLGYPALAAAFEGPRKTGLVALTTAVEEALSRDVIEFLAYRVTTVVRIDLALVDFS